MSMMSIRAATPRDREAIRLVEEHAFGQQAEAGLVDALVTGGDAVVELVAEEDGQVVGHILFSRLFVQNGGKSFPAVALAPLAVEPSFHGSGIGGALIREAHIRLKDAGESAGRGARRSGLLRPLRLHPCARRKLRERVPGRSAAGAGLGRRS